MSSWENDPRISFEVKPGDDPLDMDRRFYGVIGTIAVLMVAVVVITAVVMWIRPDRTASDLTFENNESCGGPIGGELVHFDRALYPETLMATVLDQQSADAHMVFALVNVRDDDGKLGEGTYKVWVNQNRTDPVPIDMLIALDRAPVGELQCVAWSQFQPRTGALERFDKYAESTPGELSP